MGTKALIVKFIIGTDCLLRETFWLPRKREGRTKRVKQVFMDLSDSKSQGNRGTCAICFQKNIISMSIKKLKNLHWEHASQLQSKEFLSLISVPQRKMPTSDSCSGSGW